MAFVEGLRRGQTSRLPPCTDHHIPEESLARVAVTSLRRGSPLNRRPSAEFLHSLRGDVPHEKGPRKTAALSRLTDER